MKIRKYIIQIRQYILDLNDNHPIIGRPLLFFWRILHRVKFVLGKQVLFSKGKVKEYFKELQMIKTLWVDPKKIKYFLTDYIKNSLVPIMVGDWDHSIKLIEDLLLYRAFEKKFKENKKWEETEYYQKVIEKISKEKFKWGCKSKEQWEEKLRVVESIYEIIRSNKTKLENDPSFFQEVFEKSELNAYAKDITVCIDRDGKLLLVNGKLKFSLAILSNISSVMITVKSRHKNWIEIKRKLIYLSRRGKLYQQLIHPDLQDIPYKYGDIRFNKIKENLSLTGGTLLDIGANLGYFCFKFEDEGFDCYAVENNQLYLYFLKKLKKAENKKFKIISESIFGYKKDQELNFDVVLALSVFHHFLKRKNMYFNLLNLLERLKVKEFFFEPHKLRELSKETAYKYLSPVQFVNFIIKNSCLNKVKFIGKTEKGRSLYRLTP